MGIPALDRGLDLIGSLIRINKPLKYSDLKGVIPGIADSSLNRLISSLAEKEFIEKNSDGYYVKGRALLNWGTQFQEGKTLDDRIQDVVDDIVEKSCESVALAKLCNEKIEIIYSKSAENSINVITKGTTLKFEADHAAALAILYSLPENKRVELLNSDYSEIKNTTIYENSINNFCYTSGSSIYFKDESIKRPGVSRLAIPLTIKGDYYTLFICTLTTRLAIYNDFLKQLQNGIIELKG